MISYAKQIERLGKWDAITPPTPSEIRSARKAKNLTQKEAARLIGYSLRAWEEWESGRLPMRPILWEAFKAAPTP